MRFRFEDCELDPGEARLTRAGRLVDLQPKQAEALLFFVQRPQRLVTHDELMEGLWPDVHVNEEALQQIVSKLRRALGDAAREPRFLQTVPKRGYRFLPTVETLADPAPPPAPAPIAAPPPTPISTRPSMPISARPPAPVSERAALPPAPALPPSARPPEPIAALPLPPAPIVVPLPLRRGRLASALALTFTLALAAGLIAARRSASPRPPSAGALHRLTHSLERKQEGSFSPDGRAIVYAANDAAEGQYDLYLLSLAEGSQALRLTHTPAEEYYPQLAPDGASILFSRHDHDGPSAWTIPPTGGAERKIASRAAYAAFAPDARAIAFIRPLDAGGVAIVARDLATGDERTLATAPGPAQSLSWSAAGDIAFSDDHQAWAVSAAGGPLRPLGRPAQYLRSLTWDRGGSALVADPNWSGRSGLWWIPLTGEPAPLGAAMGGVHHPALAPDGGRVLFTSESKHQMPWRFEPTGKVSPLAAPSSFDCVDADTEGRRLAGTDWEAGLEDRVSMFDLATGTREILGEGSCPRFSPDGRRLAYLRSEKGKAALWTMELGARQPRPLGLGAGEPLTPPAWSPDGERVALVMRDSAGASALVIIALDTGTAHRLSAGGFGPLAWSPDGRSIAAATPEGTWVVDAQIGTSRKVSALSSYENAPLWASDGEQLGILVDERRRPTVVMVGLDGKERGRAALPVQPDPSFWGIFTVRRLGSDTLVVQTRYEGDLYVLDLLRERN